MIHIEQDILKGFLDITVTKETSSKDFIDLITFIKTEKSFPDNISLLIKAPEGFENVRFIQLSIIADSFLELLKSYNHIAVAMVISKNRERTLSLAFQKLLLHQPCQFKTFSSLNDANIWLEKNQATNEVKPRRKAE